MPPFVTESLILKVVDFQERDLLVTFYGDERGKLRGVAKGAKASRRRFGANLDLLSLVRISGFERPGDSLVRLEGADLLEHFGPVREDLVGFARACYVAEWVDGCAAERQPVHGLLSLVLWALRSLGKGSAGEAVLRLFEIRALDLAGYGPRLDACARCGGDLGHGTSIRVEISQGGALCQSCAGGPGLRISRGTLKLLHEARSLPLGRLHRVAFSSLAMREARGLLRSFFTYHAGHTLRSSEFLESVGT
jgi:DNA repair protein RecO (recombination protein O)